MSLLRRSLFYSMANTYVGLPLQLIGTMIMSRLLTPEQTGVFAVAAVFAYFASMFRDFGVAEYLIQEKELDAAKLRAALTVNIAISWFVGLALFIAAPLAAAFYNSPGVGEVMRVQCLSFALIPFGAVTMANFRRQLDFRPIFWAGLLSNVTTFVVGIACAYHGMGYMSLAWSSLAGVVVTVAVSMWFRPRDFPRWPGLEGIGRVFEFGKFASGVYIFAQLGRGAPEMVIGRAQGMADVALFSRGGGLVELFNRLVLQSILPVCQPFFAKGHRDEGTAAHGYLQSISYLTAVGWPALFVLGLASWPAVMILYGSQWTYSAALAKVLCAAAAVELVHYLAMEALLAVGEAKRANTLQMLTQGVRVTGILAVIPFGLSGACWGLLGASVVGLCFAQRTMRAAMGFGWRQLLGSCVKSAAVAFGTAVPLSLWYFYWPPDESNYLHWTPVAAVIAVLAWVASLRAVSHPFWLELASLARTAAARAFKRPEPL